MLNYFHKMKYFTPWHKKGAEQLEIKGKININFTNMRIDSVNFEQFEEDLSEAQQLFYNSHKKIVKSVKKFGALIVTPKSKA